MFAHLSLIGTHTRCHAVFIVFAGDFAAGASCVQAAFHAPSLKIIIFSEKIVAHIAVGVRRYRRKTAVAPAIGIRCHVFSMSPDREIRGTGHGEVNLIEHALAVIAAPVLGAGCVATGTSFVPNAVVAAK